MTSSGHRAKPRRIACANWKMHKTAAETAAFFDEFLPRVAGLPDAVEIVIAPPFTSIPYASTRTAGTRVALGAQTMNAQLKGAFTGEIAAPMLREFGVRYVILGHSERRQYDNETDASVNAKVKTALTHGLTPIVCVGETLAERDAGRCDDRVIVQTRAAFDGVDRTTLRDVAIAYEPVWAIGTGKNCDPGEADRVMATIRACMAGLEETPILYGGSMKPDNVAAYAARPNIDGGLVGGASLDPAGFAALVAGAHR